MSAIDHEMLMAFVDGELDSLSSARVRSAAGSDPAVANAIEAERRVKARLAERYDPVTAEPVPERLRSLLETNVVPFEPRFASPKRRLGWRELTALAATFVAGIVGAQLIRPAPQPGAVGAAPLVASAGLARALDTQLASAQADDASTRVGVSFAARDGRLCRTFESGAIAGLACRDPERWEVLTAVGRPPRTGGDYRQAGSENLVMQVAQDMMAGAPFDAEAERRARDSGWRARR
jgi:anti-sigma factor RsiW